MSNAIEIKNLKKKYDNNFELGEINLEIPNGYIIGSDINSRINT